MKHRVLIGVMVAVFLSACHRPVETVHAPSPHLVAIDSLMQSRPDSALKVLMDFESHDTLDGHYAQLLASELLYKNYYAQTNRPELLEAMAYFDSIGDPFLSARCHYMNGVGYYEMDSVVPACEEYLKALEIMEDHYKEEELTGYKAKFMALVFSHLCELFSDQYLHEQAIYFGTQSLSYYDRYDAEPWHVAWILEKIGSHYHIMEQRDSAEYYYRRAEEVLDGMNNLSCRDNIAQQAFLSYEKGGDYKISIIKLYEIANQAENKEEYLARCLTIGEIFYCEQMFDSALVYMNYVFENTENIDSKKLAAMRLAEILRVEGKDTDLFEYVVFLASFADQEEISGATKSRLTELFNVFILKEFDAQHRAAKKTDIRLSILVTCSLLVIMLLFLSLYLINKKRKRELEKKNEEDNYAHKLQQATLKTKDYNSFFEEPICKYILTIVKEVGFKSNMDNSIYKDFALGKNQLLELRDAANRHFGFVMKRLREDYSDLSDDDLNYCCLYLLGLKEADIAALMQRSFSTVCFRNRKLKAIFNSKESIPVTLYKLINE